METAKRSIVKAMTWQMTGFVTTSGLGYFVTGSLAAGGALALSSAVIGFACYALHERLWSRVRWGCTMVLNEKDAT